MKLFYSPASPYARKIRVLAIELDLFEKIEWIESHPFDDEAQLLSANPLGKVPVLQVDGNSILDSVVICDYLQNLSEQKQPVPNPNYWKHRTQISMAQGILDVAVAWRREHMRDEALRSVFWNQRSLAATKRSLSWFSETINSVKPFPDMAAITLACALEYLSFRHPQLQWEKQFPELVGWLAEQQKRESMKRSKPEE